MYSNVLHDPITNIVCAFSDGIPAIGIFELLIFLLQLEGERELI